MARSAWRLRVDDFHLRFTASAKDSESSCASAFMEMIFFSHQTMSADWHACISMGVVAVASSASGFDGSSFTSSVFITRPRIQVAVVPAIRSKTER